MNKKRIVSTVFLGLFLIACITILVVFFPVSWKMINEAVEQSKNNTDSVTGEVVSASAVAFAGALTIVFVFIFIGIDAIVSAICLPFSIRNRKSVLKPIRIISYIYIGLFSTTLIMSIIKIILLICGV